MPCVCVCMFVRVYVPARVGMYGVAHSSKGLFIPTITPTYISPHKATKPNATLITNQQITSSDKSTLAHNLQSQGTVSLHSNRGSRLQTIYTYHMLLCCQTSRMCVCVFMVVHVPVRACVCVYVRACGCFVTARSMVNTNPSYARTKCHES